MDINSQQSEPVSSSEDDLIVEEEEPATPKVPKAEPGTSAAGSSTPSSAATSTPSFPPHEYVIDGDQQQWVYYRTMKEDEVVGTIADTFEADPDEVIESNASRYGKMNRKSKLKKGTLLVIGACDTLLLCSECRRDECEGDPILICRDNW